MLFKDSITDQKWNIMVSAKWLDNHPVRSTIFNIISLIHEDKELQSQIDRVIPAMSKSTIVTSINNSFVVTKSTTNLQNCSISGLNIPLALLLESTKTISTAQATQ